MRNKLKYYFDKPRNTNTVTVYIEKLRPDVRVPFYNNDGDAGMDVYLPDDVVIGCEETILVPLGFKIAVPKGYEMQMRPRSGVSLKTPLRIANSPGTIDSGYRGEVGVILDNTRSCKGLHLNKGDRVAQLVLKQVEVCKWTEVDSVDNIGLNRGGGFGSTGK